MDHSVALWQPFQDSTWGWALRLGMLVSVLGSASGGLMTSPTSAQLEQMRMAAGGDWRAHRGRRQTGPGHCGCGLEQPAWRPPHSSFHWLACAAGHSVFCLAGRAQTNQTICFCDGRQLSDALFVSSLASYARRIDCATRTHDPFCLAVGLRERCSPSFLGRNATVMLLRSYMSADQLFSVCNSAALLGWLILAIAGRRRAGLRI